ncbi:MAG: ATP-binding protein, partial [Candidatus Latescibacteria bacterium]|nr:ATP-binding protein [Candidatus Latescibacterota bacterium]
MIFIGGSLYQILFELDLIDRSILFFPYIYGALALMLSMSIYLAQIFARTHRNLEQQLVQAKELSALALAQEREALRLEKQAEEDREKRQLLEADNALKSTELEEAQRRQSIYESLQQKNLALQETQTKLVQSEKMASLGNLVAGIAHEINTPVGAINSMHDTLMRAVDRLKGVLETQYHDDLQNNRPMRAALRVIQDGNRVIATGTERVTEIVRSLRSFARLDEAEMKEANLHEGIENTLTLVHHDLKNRIEVVRDYSDIPPVTCFPSRLNQVFLNLLVNAGQAIDGQGKIAISTRRVEDEVEIGITDSGKGIPEENVARIFDPGFTTKGVGV